MLTSNRDKSPTSIPKSNETKEIQKRNNIYTSITMGRPGSLAMDMKKSWVYEVTEDWGNRVHTNQSIFNGK